MQAKSDFGEEMYQLNRRDQSRSEAWSTNSTEDTAAD